MDVLREFRIPFVGLKLGRHEFKFELDERFFRVFEDSPVSVGNVLVKLDLEKHNSFFTLHFELDGTVQTECDRCAEDFDLEIFGDFDFYVKFMEPDMEPKEEEVDVIWIYRNETHLELGQLLYEMVVLSLPMVRNCGEPGPNNPKCKLTDPELLKNILSEEDKAGEEPKEGDKPTDPRWEALLKLKSNK